MSGNLTNIQIDRTPERAAEIARAMGLSPRELEEKGITLRDIQETQEILFQTLFQASESRRSRSKRSLSLSKSDDISSSPRTPKRQHLLTSSDDESTKEIEEEVVQSPPSPPSSSQSVGSTSNKKVPLSLSEIKKLIEKVQKKIQEFEDEDGNVNQLTLFHSVFSEREDVNGDIFHEKESIYTNGNNTYIAKGFYLACVEMTKNVRRMLQLHDQAVNEKVYADRDVNLVFHVRSENNTSDHSQVKQASLLALWKVLQKHVTEKKYKQFPNVHVYVGQAEQWFTVSHVAYNAFRITKERSSRI